MKLKFCVVYTCWAQMCNLQVQFRIAHNFFLVFKDVQGCYRPASVVISYDLKWDAPSHSCGSGWPMLKPNLLHRFHSILSQTLLLSCPMPFFFVDILYVKFWAISWVLQWTQHVNLCVKLIIIPSNKYQIEEKDSQQWQCFYSIKVLFATLLIIAGLLHTFFYNFFFKPGKSVESSESSLLF